MSHITIVTVITLIYNAPVSDNQTQIYVQAQQSVVNIIKN